MRRNSLSICNKVMLAVFILASASYAGTRIKTIEYSFGSYYSTTNITSGTTWTPSSVTVYIPEGTRTIREAWLEAEFITTAATNVSNIDIDFDAGGSASTARDGITGIYGYNTGKQMRYWAKADVTNAIGSGASQQYSASVTVTGVATNGHSLKLYITYEYDDTSSVQIKTVRFPLNYAANVAAGTAQQLAATTKAYAYNAAIADATGAGITIRQQWFEIRGYRQPSTTVDTGITVKVTGQATGSSTYIADGSLTDSYDFKMLDHQGNTSLTGFTINTAQSLDISSTGTAMNVVSGECVVTYEYSDAAATKTKTARFTLGQLIGSTGGALSDNIYLEETGATIVNMYAQIYGSNDSTTAVTIVLNSSVGGVACTQRSYPIISTATQTSGHTFFHDLTERKANWSNGAAVAVTVGSLASNGGHGAELIVTYNYTDENSQYTSYYQTLGGQSADGLQANASQTFNQWFPTYYGFSDGTLTLRNFGVRVDITEGGNASNSTTSTGDYLTSLAINSTSTQVVTHRTGTETHGDYALYKNAGQVTSATSTAAANMTLSACRGPFGSVTNTVFSFFKSPNPPSSLVQYRNDGTTVIPTGSYTNQTTAVFKFAMNSPYAADNLTPQVEIEQIGTSFSNTATSSGTALTYTGADVTGTVTVTLATGISYHWQARVTGLKGNGPWVVYPDGSPNLESEADIICDASNPSFTDNQTGDDTWRSTSGTTYSISFSDTGSSNLSYVQYGSWTGAGQTGSNSIPWTTIATNIGAATYTTPWTVAYASLPEGINYISVRAYDAATNTAVLTDCFYVKKDVTVPGITDSQAGDNVWRKTGGTTYTVTFSDAGGANINYMQYGSWTGANQTGSNSIPWTTIATNVSAATYTTPWTVNFSGLVDGTNYISVRVIDYATNTTTLTDPFYIKKDATAPTFGTNQTGDNTWRATGGTTYTTSFTDTGGSNLSYVQYGSWTGVGQTGANSIPWTTIATNIGAATYTTPWTVAFASLAEGSNYISVRAFDVSTNTEVLTDSFFIKKDTVNPGITDSQSGDDTWRNTNGTTYTVTFSDSGSLLNYARYVAYSGAGRTGSPVTITSPTIFTNIGAATYTTPWTIDFAAFPQGQTYVSVDVYDVSGKTSALNDVFYLKKDTASPTFGTNQVGDNTWRSTGGTTYTTSFADTGGSNLSYVQYGVWAGPGQTSTNTVPWTNIASSVGASTYTTPWTVSYAALSEGTNYVSVRAFDVATNTAVITDSFFIKKDATAPGITDSQSGDNTWRTSADGSVYNVTFSDTGGSNLSYVQYGSWTGVGQTGTNSIPWTNIASSLGTATYTTPWTVSFGALAEGINYISARAYDVATNLTVITEPFYIKKDTNNPTVTNLPGSGDDNIRSAPGTAYTVGFADNATGSLLNYAEYRVCSGTNGSGTTVIPWTTIATNIGAATYTTAWTVNWNTLLGGAVNNYVSVRAYDTAGLGVTVQDAFYIKKDATPPAILDNQAGDDTWRTASGTTYNVGASKAAGNKLDYIEYTVNTAPNRSGAEVKAWTTIVTNINAYTYNDTGSTPWTVDFSALNEGVNYVSVRAFDTGATGITSDVFHIKKDTVNPGVTDSQAGDDTWRTAGGTTYNVTFADATSLLNRAEYRACTGTSGTGTTVITWTPIASNINTSTYTTPWTIDFTSLATGQNYISVRDYDNAGRTNSVNDVFYVKKDPYDPVITNNETATKVITTSPWLGTTGSTVTYNIDFNDDLNGTITNQSGLDYAQYAIYSAANLAGSQLKNWTNIASSIGVNTYTTDFTIDFAACQGGVNYVSVRVYDVSGRTAQINDAFYVRKDLTGPTYTNNQAGDDTWRKTAGTTYDVDFGDTGTGINTIQYAIYSAGALGGSQLKNWTNITTGTGIATYTSNFTIDFTSCQEGNNYISVRATDAGLNTTVLTDAFYVKKDSVVPGYIDNQPGDDTWRNTGGTTYSITFSDSGSQLSSAEYIVYNAAGQGGSLVKNWTSIASGINAATYTNNWAVDYNSLIDGTNYVSVKVIDNATNTTIVTDVFYVKKDEGAPTFTTVQTGDAAWRVTNGTTYTTGFSDTVSQLSKVQYIVMTGTGLTGSTLKPWTDIASSINASTYTTPWTIDFSVLDQGLNYVSVKAIDNTTNTSVLTDNFFVKKDTQGPSITNNVVGGDAAWRNTAGTTYDVSFADDGSFFNYFQYRAMSGTGGSGTTLIPWTTVVTNVGAATYSTPWTVTFSSLGEGTNYISVRAFDMLGTTTLSTDAFYIKKDTTAPSAITNLAATVGLEGNIVITFTARGDDAMAGTAASYVIKIKQGSNFTGTTPDFDGANTFDQAITPAVPTSTETITITGLTSNLTYYVAIKTIDKAGNSGALSNLTGNSCLSGPDITAPASITDLAAISGVFPGEVILSWNAPGDNASIGDLQAPPNGGYLVKYSTTPITNAATFTSATTFVQSWAPSPAGTPESIAITMPQTNILYYFSVKAYDEAGNYSIVSTTAVSATSASLGPAAGNLMYGVNAQAYPTVVPWTGTAWGASGNGATASTVIRWIREASCPVVRNEKIAGVLSSTGAFQIQRYNGSTSTWTTEFTTSGLTAALSAYRPFDIAYEQNSGRCIVVYGKGTATAEVAYRIWNGASWSTPETTIELGTTGIVRFVRLEPRPGTNEMMLVTLDANSDIYAFKWDGTSAFVAGFTVTAVAANATMQNYDVAWETTTGKCKVVAALAATPWTLAATCTNTTWATVAGPSTGVAGRWLKLAADPNSGSNNIAMASSDSASAWYVSVWTGAAWGAIPTKTTLVTSTYRGFDVAWEKDTSKCLAVGATSATNVFSYITWQSNAWSANPNAAPKDGYTWPANLRWLELTSDPNTNGINLTGQDQSGNLRSRYWSTGTWNVSTAHTGTSSSTISENYVVAFDRHDKIPPDIINNLSGADTTWRNTNSGSYNIDFSDAGGSNLAYLQVKACTAVSQGGTVLSDWTNAITGINASTYTTNWTIPTTVWNVLQEGTNYISTKIFDGVGNSSFENDSFFIRKDTTAPGITNNIIGGDTAWRNSAGTTYNVTFADNGSLLNNVQYIVCTGTGLTGTTLKAWTDISSSIDAATYTTPWTVDFTSLQEGVNYVSVRAYDNLNQAGSQNDVFVINKDTVAPSNTTTLSAVPGIIKGQIKLTWTAVGDNGGAGNNILGSYTVRTSTLTIANNGDFDAATDYSNSWTPVNAGLTETRFINGLTPGTTYYFAIKTNDKAGNVSVISNGNFCQPQAGNVHINEVYTLGSTAANDWIELFSDTATTSVSGWTLTYNNGTLSTPGTNTTVWTGGSTATLTGSTFMTMSPSVNMDGAAQHFLVLKDSNGLTVDTVQWAALTGVASDTNISFAALLDGGNIYELDPTPTKNLANALSGTVKLNEISYDQLTQQFVEIYNTAVTAVTLTSNTLRNKNCVSGSSPYRKTFSFTRAIDAKNFTAIDNTSTDNSANTYSYTSVFGGSGLTGAGDFVVLENASGQVLDRVTWQTSGNYSYFDATGALVPYPNAATGGLTSPNTLGRIADGVDTNNDTADWDAFVASSEGRRNNPGTAPAVNTFTNPVTNMARNIKLTLTLGADSSGGFNDTIWFIRTGGTADAKSPHIYRLSDLGFNLASTSAQSVSITGATTNDIDGNALVGGSYYRILLNTDNAAGAPAQISKSNVYYDGAVHSAVVTNIASNAGTSDNSAKEPLLKITVTSSSSSAGNDLELNSLRVKFTDSGSTALSTAQAKALFENILLVRDNASLGTAGLYQPAFDTDVLKTVANAAISLDGSGYINIPVVNPDLAASTIPKGGSAVFFVVGELKSNANTASPNSFKAAVDADTDLVIRDAVYDNPQSLNATLSVSSTAMTVIAPAPPPVGTSYPATIGGAGAETLSGPAGFNRDTEAELYIGGSSGKLYSLNVDGSTKWTTPFDTSAPISSAPQVEIEGSSTFIYAANDSGVIFKIKDLGASGTTVGGWTLNLGAVVKSEPVIDTVRNTMYVGAADQKLYKINTDTGAVIWDTSASISGNLTGSVAVDEFTSGMNSCWIGSESGSLYRVNTSNGQVLSTLDTGAAIKSSPFIDAGYVTGVSNNLFITSTDGKIYCRASANLTTMPDGWKNRGGQQDGNFNVGSPIETIPFVDLNSSPKAVYFGANNGKMYKLNAETGTLIWEFQTGGPIKSSAIVLDQSSYFPGIDAVFFGSDDGKCYAVKISDGTLKDGWPITTGAEVRAMPVVSGLAEISPGIWSYRDITFTSKDGKVYTLQIQ